MITGQSEIYLKSIFDLNKKRKRKQTVVKENNYNKLLYDIIITNLTFDDLEYIYSVINFINDKRSEMDEEKIFYRFIE